jgi:hypothetical protein
MLQHDVLAVVFFPRAHAGKVFRTLPIPGSRPFAFPKAGKIFGSPECDLLHSPMPENAWSLEPGQVSLQEPDFYGMEECKISHYRDRKTVLAFVNAKGLLTGTQRVFCYGGM